MRFALLCFMLLCFVLHRPCRRWLHDLFFGFMQPLGVYAHNYSFYFVSTHFSRSPLGSVTDFTWFFDAKICHFSSLRIKKRLRSS